MKKLTLLLIAVLTSLGMVAQNVNVSGTVRSSLDGEPLIGVTVMVKGSTTGTATDVDGNFSINAKQGSTLQFSYIGYTPQEVKVSANNSKLNINLIEDSQILDDVVVVGYGRRRRAS